MVLRCFRLLQNTWYTYNYVNNNNSYRENGCCICSLPQACGHVQLLLAKVRKKHAARTEECINASIYSRCRRTWCQDLPNLHETLTSQSALYLSQWIMTLHISVSCWQCVSQTIELPLRSESETEWLAAGSDHTKRRHCGGAGDRVRKFTQL